MSFRKIALDYLASLRKELQAGIDSDQATPELSYRTCIDVFIKKVTKSIKSSSSCILEPKKQYDAGRPDWRIHDSKNMSVFGYIEAKPPDLEKELDPSQFSIQLQKYLSLGNHIILTDGIEFILFKPNGASTRFLLVDKPVKWNEYHVNTDIETMFRDFLSQTGSRRISEVKLIEEVASRAKFLRDEVLSLLSLEIDEAEDEIESHTIESLKRIKKSVEANHDSSLHSDYEFASFIAQILSFGLLYSHRIVSAGKLSPSDKYREIQSFWNREVVKSRSEHLIPIQVLIEELSHELSNGLSKLGAWYDNLRCRLAYVTLASNSLLKPDYHKLYEAFLLVYDPKTRFDYGAFYTPRCLAFYMVRLANYLLINSISPADLANVNLKIIDPCCGTGTFIEAVLETLKSVSSSDITGFEILPVPFSLANLRMTMLNLGSSRNVKLVLTNTLRDGIQDEESCPNTESFDEALFKEQVKAQQYATPPITLLIGNPPSSDSKQEIENEGQKIRDLLDRFRPPKEERRIRQNTQKQVRNEFMKFLAWTTDKALNSIPSVFMLVVPSAFASHPSYKYARKFIVDNFSELWVFEFDKDMRRGDSGGNLFHTMQGRMVIGGVKVSTEPTPCKVRYLNITDMDAKEKESYLSTADINTKYWNSLVIDENLYSLKKSAKIKKDLEYNNFWDLTNDNNSGVFYRHCSGIKLSPTSLLIHTSKGQLTRRLKYVSKSTNTYSMIRDTWFSGQKKPPREDKISPDVKKHLADHFNPDSVFRYSYRPFIISYAYIDSTLLNILKKQSGGGTRERPEVVVAFKDSRVIGFSVSPSTEDIGDVLHRFSSFCWFAPDNDLSSRGNGHVFCNYFPEYKVKSNWNKELHQNVNHKLTTKLVETFVCSEASVIDDIVFYAYAVLNSEFYLNKFNIELYGVADGWSKVKIPITANKHLFKQVTDIGRSISELERQKSEPESNSLYGVDFSYYYYEVTDSSIVLKGKNKNLLYEIPNIPSEVLNFRVSGYHVVKEWLKLHSFAYFRKCLSSIEVTELHALLRRIEGYLSLMPILDSAVEKIVNGKLITW